MPRIIWDEAGKRFYETGVDRCVLYVQDETGAYPKGVAWNGITSINESPSGADSTPIYADNIKYLDLRAVEEFGATIECITYPDEFMECDGSKEVVAGITASQQPRKKFGLCYRTKIGNDIQGTELGYKIHIIYGATASPSERSNSTINDSPETATFSYELSTTPVDVPNLKPTAHLVIDSTKLDKEKLKKIEDLLYGTNDQQAKLVLPDVILTTIQ